MGAVSACGDTPPPPEDYETHTPHRNVRVPDERWHPFGAAVGSRNRSSWINEFITWVVDDPQLWRDARTIAARRNEQVGNVIATALRRYVARHHSVLDRP